MLENADGLGLTLGQLIEKTLATVFAYGRAGLCADYRNMGDPHMSVADAEMIYPSLMLVMPENIINWHIDRSTKQVLKVVVREEYEDLQKYEVRKQWQYREFSLEPTLVVRLWRCLQGTFEMIEEMRPMRADGMPWDIIPFCIIGSVDNDWTVDRPPLYPIASLDLQLYKQYADLNDYAHLIGQPSVFFSGLDEGYAQREWKGGLRVGTRNLIPLPPGATAGILQANPQTITSDLASRYQELLRSFGATLYIPGQVGQDQTATGAVYEALQMHSPLISASRNVVDAFRRSLRYAAEYVGANPDEITVDLNSDMLDNPMGVAGMPLVIQLKEAGLLTWDEARKQLEVNQLTLYDPEEAMQRIQEEEMGAYDQAAMDEGPMVSDRTTDDEESVMMEGEDDGEPPTNTFGK